MLCAYPAGLSAQTAASSPMLGPRQTAAGAEADRKPAGLPSAVTIGGSLALVLGVFFLGMWLFRQASPAGFGLLPPEAFETLGRGRLNARQHVHLLRCGNKLLLVSVGVAGAETLTEITDPEEVERLVELCRRGRRGGAAAFRQVFSARGGPQ